ncbi:isoprenylcysteine carboxylmethyltransferase family protein [Roseobacter sp. YSTF-M11]|uniref:Isoprenylcysteine carboxylmethyltransferase family protein n=1 Tax=Roseobacter insulae TaxID=2859783 RepID=A0A9X1FUE8_9RHOB|nr:isoprenylcysteine carboxylmethyltransferase family protein [Roseobacter insulae]MBW4707868.1 isoprenylcysteine carboxylmethyltransferase family protein [Roseobacter insulae]
MKWVDLPPVWLVVFAVIAWLQATQFPFGLSLAHPVTMLLAGVLVGGGIVLTLLAVMEFRRHKTTIIPHETPDSLIQSGIFARSRNPIYLADVLILAGLCLWWDAVLALVLVPVLAWVLEKRFIIPEENRMRRHFRADFARYEQKVRRWL